MGLNIDYIEGQTPLDEDEKEGLLIKTISTRGELDEFEQKNIEDALSWILKRSFKMENLLTENFIKNIHYRMYSDVWKWAGRFRDSNKNIGVDKFEIGVNLKNLLDDSLYWIENKTYEPDEIAIRFKHRIVSIHSFPNGNGRHSRMMADILINKIFGKELFNWGSTNLGKEGSDRKSYIESLRNADKGNIASLLKFARS